MVASLCVFHYYWYRDENDTHNIIAFTIQYSTVPGQTVPVRARPSYVPVTGTLQYDYVTAGYNVVL